MTAAKVGGIAPTISARSHYFVAYPANFWRVTLLWANDSLPLASCPPIAGSACVPGYFHSGSMTALPYQRNFWLYGVIRSHSKSNTAERTQLGIGRDDRAGKRDVFA